MKQREGPERCNAGAGRETRSSLGTSNSASRQDRQSSFRLVTVTEGRRSCGHVLRRGARGGFEAFDCQDVSIGTFPTLRDAANAVTDAAEKEAS